jgi:hypothetical protein
MAYDYSQAPPPRQPDLIPAGTVCTVQMRIRPGGAGEDGILKRSSNGDCEMLDCEFVVVDGEHARRKFWCNMLVNGTTPDQQSMAEVWCRTRKTILESARNINPNDASPEARARYVAELKDFDELIFIAKVGIEKGKPNKSTGENYPDKNTLAGVITPDKKEYRPIPQSPPFNGGGSGASAGPATGGAPPSPLSGGVPKPGWAS